MTPPRGVESLACRLCRPPGPTSLGGGGGGGGGGGRPRRPTPGLELIDSPPSWTPATPPAPSALPAADGPSSDGEHVNSAAPPSLRTRRCSWCKPFPWKPFPCMPFPRIPRAPGPAVIVIVVKESSRDGDMTASGHELERTSP
jgi:hypothetical protein